MICDEELMMRSRSVAMAAVFTALMLAAPALAQPPGGFGGGGFGGGVGGRGGFGADPVSLLRMEEVQKELELLDDQKEKIDALTEANRNRERPDFGNIREMSEAERQQLFARLRTEREKQTAETKEKLGEILLPHQMERLEQLVIQRQGLGALNNPEVAAKLKISEGQQEKIRTTAEEASEKMREEMRALFQGGNREGNREQIQEKMAEARAETEKQVLAVLTDAQKKQFDEMKGEPFTFPQPQFGQGGPGGRRGEAGQGGRPGGRFGNRQGGNREGGQGRRPRPDSDQ
jgi:hypothetical protein